MTDVKHGSCADMEREWSTWQSTDPDSPDRIDAPCILVYGLIPEANAGAIAHSPLPQAPQGGGNRAASPYSRRIG